MEERFRNLDYQNWKPVRTLGSDSYGTVYEIARDDGFGMVDHAALKVLSIPAAPEDFDALVAEGRTPEEVTALLHRQVETIARQLMAVDAISDEPNLLRCEDHVIRAHADGRGWDIYVRTELLPSLPDYLRNHPHGEADIIRLGAGLCSALETCHRRGIVHGDIKPRNVFVGGGNFDEQVTYKLGDFGMAQFSAVDNTNDFMAPEVLCGAEVSPASDLYSVGMVLYWALNERRIPFVPLPPTAVEASDLAIAREQRLRGDPLPEPLHGSQALKNVVMRACADDPAQRYASVEEFRAALLAVARRAAAAQPQQAQAVRREVPAPKAAAADTFPGSKPKAQRKAVPVETEDTEKPHNAKKTVAIILGSLVVVALIAHAGGRDDLLEHVEHLRAHAQRLREALGADGHDHELLNIDVAAGGVRAAVEHVHHRHGQRLGVAAADVVIQALAGRQRAGLRACEGHAEDGVGAETGLVRRAVELDEELVDRGLVEDVHALQRLCDLDIHVLHGLEHALAEVTALIAVTQLAGLVDTGGSAGGNSRAADGAVVERDFHFHSRVAAGVENFSGADVHNFKIILHVHTPL